MQRDGVLPPGLGRPGQGVSNFLETHLLEMLQAAAEAAGRGGGEDNDKFSGTKVFILKLYVLHVTVELDLRACHNLTQAVLRTCCNFIPLCFYRKKF